MRRTPAERTRDWYQANARHYDRRNPGLPGDRAYYASLCHGARVLEIGAGTGRVTEAIAGTARSVIAVDNVPAMLAIASRRLHHIPTISLVLADAGNLPFSTEFDRIVLAYRTVQQLERAGAAVIMIEDSTGPESELGGKGVAMATKDVMLGRIRAAVDARRDPATMIMARSDRPAKGYSEAETLDLLNALSEAGADAFFINGYTLDQAAAREDRVEEAADDRLERAGGRVARQGCRHGLLPHR